MAAASEGSPRLWLDGDHLNVRFAGGEAERRAFDEADTATLRGLTSRYARACSTANPSELRRIGRELGQWLQGPSQWLNRLIEDQDRPPLVLEIAGRLDTTPPERELLAAPWELVVNPSDETFLAEQRVAWAPVRCLVPRRQLTGNLQPLPAADNALTVLFMAAAPTGAAELAYEQEEQAILDATRTARREAVDLVVEETGTASELGRRLAELTEQAPVAVVHLSCHGSANPPRLQLEDEVGDPKLTTAAQLRDAFPTAPLAHGQLLFVSACETATHSGGEAAHALTHELVQEGFGAALGWGGSVQDSQATVFAAALYRRLALGDALPLAVGSARRELLTAEPSSSGDKRNDWHMARLVLAQRSGGPLATVSGTRRPRANVGGAFLDADRRTVPVATREEFVGRRRALQRLLREVRAHPKQHAGIVVHGVGGQGKSSLVARLADRLHDHKVVVLHGEYSTAVLWARLDQLEPGQAPSGAEPISPAHLEARLTARLRTRSEKQPPLLLVVDDFERVLEAQTDQPHRINDSSALEAIRALVRAFRAVRETESALVFTSRFPFALSDTDGRDLGTLLFEEHLPGMEIREARKQALALGLTPGAPTNGGSPQAELVRRALATTGGNPALNRLVLQAIRTETATETTQRATRLVEALEQKNPALAEDEALTRELQRLAVEQMLKWLPDSQRQFLRLVATLFRGQLPVVVLEALAESATQVLGFKRDCFGPQLARLGFLEPGTLPDFKTDHVLQLSGLVRLHLANIDLTPALRQQLLQDFVPKLQSVLAARSAKVATAEALEWLTLALEVASAELARAYGYAGLSWLQGSLKGVTLDELQRAADLAATTMRVIESGPKAPGALLARVASRLAIRPEQSPLVRRWLSAAAQAAEDDLVAGEIAFTDASDVLRDYASALTTTGQPHQALESLQKLKTLLEQQNLPIDLAATLGDIARIYRHQGKPLQALELHKQAKQVYEQFGDTRSLAITLGDIARIYRHQGKPLQALELHEQERQVYEQLGDAHSLATTLADIARIYTQQGKPLQALELHEQAKHVYEQLGDAHSLAITLGDIARIYTQQDKPALALELHEQEKQVYEQLGDVRSLAITLGDIARIYHQQGKPVQALELLEKARQVHERLRDARSLAATLGDTARIYAEQGKLAEAKALQSERLKANRDLNDVDGIAAASWDLAQIAVMENDARVAFGMATEAFTLFRELGRADGIALVGQSLGMWLCTAEQWQPAVRVLQPALAMAQRLGWKAQIAQIDALLTQCAEHGANLE